MSVRAPLPSQVANSADFADIGSTPTLILGSAAFTAFTTFTSSVSFSA